MALIFLPELDTLGSFGAEYLRASLESFAVDPPNRLRRPLILSPVLYSRQWGIMINSEMCLFSAESLEERV
jgi:hypothetical protein